MRDSLDNNILFNFIKQDIIACINYYNIVKTYRTQINFKNLKFIIASSV